MHFPAIVPGPWLGEILAGVSANFGQVVQPGSPCQSVITTPGGDWRLSAARIQIAALKAGELTKSIQVVNVSFPLAEGLAASARAVGAARG
jgi:hypothetical protein